MKYLQLSLNEKKYIYTNSWVNLLRNLRGGARKVWISGLGKKCWRDYLGFSILTIVWNSHLYESYVYYIIRVIYIYIIYIYVCSSRPNSKAFLYLSFNSLIRGNKKINYFGFNILTSVCELTFIRVICCNIYMYIIYICM